MIFSSPDMLDEADVVPLSAFMEACMAYVPEKQKKMLEQVRRTDCSLLMLLFATYTNIMVVVCMFVV
jgi:hypothetical protein